MKVLGTFQLKKCRALETASSFPQRNEPRRFSLIDQVTGQQCTLPSLQNRPLRAAGRLSLALPRVGKGRAPHGVRCRAGLAASFHAAALRPGGAIWVSGHQALGAGLDEGNRNVAQATRERPGRFRPYLTINPHRADRVKRLLESASANGFDRLKFHP